MVIEPLAVRLPIKRATNEEVKMIERIYFEFQKSVIENNLSKLVTTDELFHTQIIKASHSKLLISMNENISNLLREYRTKSFAIRENAVQTLECHKKIIEAIKIRSVEFGQKEMLNHISIALTEIPIVIKTDK